MSWLQWLRKYNPETGRYIRENGEYFNMADGAKRADDTNFLASVEDGQVYHASWRGQIGVGASVFFSQPVNTTDDVRGIAFQGSFSGGPIEYRLYLGGTLGTTAETLTGFNADRRIDETSINPIIRIDAYTPGTLIDQSFGLTSTSGSGRASSSLTSIGVGGIFDSTHSPTFELENTGNDAVEIALSWIWKERGEL